MKISSRALWEAIVKVHPNARVRRDFSNYALPEALKDACVELVLHAKEYDNATSFDYGLATHYIEEALKELRKEGFLTFANSEQPKAKVFIQQDRRVICGSCGHQNEHLAGPDQTKFYCDRCDHTWKK